MFKLCRLPVFTAEEALRVAVVAVVQPHHKDVLQGEAARFAADGIAALLVQPLLRYQGGEDAGQGFGGARILAGLPVGPFVGRADQVVPPRAAVTVAVHAPRNHCRAQVGGEEAAQLRARPAEGRGRGAVFDAAAAGVLGYSGDEACHGGVVVTVFPVEQQRVLQPALMFDLPDAVPQAAQVGEGEMLPRGAVRLVQHFGVNVDCDALLPLFLHPLRQGLAAVDGFF